MTWIAWYYVDGQFRPVAGVPFYALPREGFVAIEQLHEPPYRDVFLGTDFVVFRGDKFENADSVEGLQASAWIEGTLVPDAEWERFRLWLMTRGHRGADVLLD